MVSAALMHAYVNFFKGVKPEMRESVIDAVEQILAECRRDQRQDRVFEMQLPKLFEKFFRDDVDQDEAALVREYAYTDKIAKNFKALCIFFQNFDANDAVRFSQFLAVCRKRLIGGQSRLQEHIRAGLGGGVVCEDLPLTENDCEEHFFFMYSFRNGNDIALVLNVISHAFSRFDYQSSLVSDYEIRNAPCFYGKNMLIDILVEPLGGYVLIKTRRICQ